MQRRTSTRQLSTNRGRPEANAEREALGVTTNVIDAVAGVLKRTCEEIGPDADVTAVIQPIENRAGVKVRAPAQKT